VQASRLLSSYPVPPTSSFTCPPCSVRILHPSGSISSRYTACTIQQSECEIRCFKETPKQLETPEISTCCYPIEDQTPPVYIDFIPIITDRGGPDPLPDILVVHRDGTIRRISGDLQETRWVCASVAETLSRALSPEVLSAHWINYAEASTALLRKRDDILKGCAASESSFLVLVYRDGDHQESGVRFSVFDVPVTLRNSFNSSNHGQRLQLLLSNPLPESKRLSLAADLQIDFHAPSARLSLSSRNELINYDVSAYVPEVSCKLFFEESHFSLFPLSGTLAAGALRSAVEIYDMKYQSVKAHFDLNTKSRRRGPEDSARKAVRFILYFAKTNTLVGVRGRNLLTFNLPIQRTKRRSSSQAESLLIDSLRYNTYVSARVTAKAHAGLGPGFSKALFVPNQLEKAGWEARQKKVDELVHNNEVEEFERFMVNELENVAVEDSSSKDPSHLWLPSDEQFVASEKIRYLLSKIFRPSTTSPTVGAGETGACVIIAFYPPRLMKWLARHNYLRTPEIERALSDEHSPKQLKLGAVADAIVGQDPSLSLLAEYLGGANIVGLDEVVTMVKILIKNEVTMAQTRPPTQRLLLEDSHTMALDEADSYRQDISSSQSQSETTAGGWSGESMTALNRALEIFYGFLPFNITSAIRMHLDIDEILALIQFLRQQLFRSGHTSSFPSFSAASNGDVLALEITVTILSSCIDALGALTFLGATSNQELWQGLVPDLKAEISLALAGIEEATYLKGVVQEVVRYGNAATSAQVRPSGSFRQHLGEEDAEAGNFTWDHAEPMDEHIGDLREVSSLLPLSLKMEDEASKTERRREGGEVVAKTRREMQYLRSRNIGRYSFERLIL
jgi:hypothetical protein